MIRVMKLLARNVAFNIVIHASSTWGSQIFDFFIKSELRRNGWR